MQKFFIFLLTVNLASINSASIAFAVSAGTGVTAIANLFIAMIFVLSMVCILITSVCNDNAINFPVQLFGGFLIALQSLPNWLQWLKYASFFRYATEVGINDFSVAYNSIVYLYGGDDHCMDWFQHSLSYTAENHLYSNERCLPTFECMPTIGILYVFNEIET